MSAASSMKLSTTEGGAEDDNHAISSIHSKQEESSSSKSPLLLLSSEDDEENNMSSDTSQRSVTKVVEKASPGGVVNFKLLLLILMVLQNSCTVLVGRYTRSGVPKDEMFNVNHFILICEVSKFIMSCALEHFYGNPDGLWPSLQIHVLDRPMDCLKISIPALLYLVQNILLYTALANLTAPIFQVTYQAKLVTTALVSVLLLKRSYSLQQWVCLIFLSLGVAIVVLGEQKPKEETTSANNKSQNLLVGLVAVSIACFSSALAGVYFEMVLKKPADPKTDKTSSKKIIPPASLWMRNIQLSFFSVIIAVVQGFFQKTSDDDDDDVSYLHGFTFWPCVLVCLQAGGGLLVAAVIKYADNVLKGLATGVSVVFATSVSMVLFDTKLSTQFTFGAVLILTSVYYFSNPLPTTKTMWETKDTQQ